MTAPMPFGPKPSILDRVAARLFPTGAYTGLLDPGQQAGLQRQGLQNVGLNLLQAGGAAPFQRGTLANIGGAIQGVNFPQMADQALQLQAYRSQMAQQQAIAQASANHPARAGETPADTYARLAQIAAEISTIPGGDAVAAKLAPIMAALKPEKGGEPIRIEHSVDNQLGSPTIGRAGTLLIDPASGRRVGFYPESGSGREPMKIENTTDTQPGANPGVKGTLLVDPATRQRLGFYPTVPAGGGAGAALVGAESRAAAQRLAAAHLDGTQLETKNVIPSTAAAIAGGAAKLFGERASTGITTALRASSTNQEQQAAGRWADAYLSLAPKGRAGSVGLREQIMRTYWPQEGDDQASVIAKTSARKAATAALIRAVATGTPPPLPGFEPEAP